MTTVAPPIQWAAQPVPGQVGREIGIPAVPRAPWGTHFCQFYRTKQDLLDILVPYFRSGLASHEFCMWITSEPLEAAEAAAAMRAAVPDFDRVLRDRQMEIIPYTDWYVQDGGFDGDRVLSAWVAKLTDAQARGYEGLRLSGNTFWLEQADWRDFTAYEEAVNSVITQYKMIALCTYSLEKCSFSELLDVLAHHQFALIRRETGWELLEPSERKLATEAVEQMNLALEQRTAELQDALDELQTFSYSVSHDLKAPLRAIASFSGYLDENYRDSLDDRGQHMLARIGANAAQMERLISDILAYSLAQRTNLESTVLDMARLARSAYQQVGGEPGREVELVIGDLPPAAGDPAMIEEVLANLLSNALKYTRGEQAARIEVGAEAADGGTAYYVRDNGVGFDMAYAGKLFAAFERLHSASEFEGTGLGLAIARQIVTRHGGRVWAEAAPGEGATFYFTLPPAGSGSLRR